MRPDLLTVAEEDALRQTMRDLRFDPIVMHGRTARRTARRSASATTTGPALRGPGAPLPGWLLPVRRRAADLAGEDPEALIEALVQHYPRRAAIGWHRDAPAFGKVVGISVGASCRLRFQRGRGDARGVFAVTLEPRSGYVLAGAARWPWQHSIPAAEEERWSITFRTLRGG